MKQEWKYGKPSFDSDKYNDTLLRFSPWSGHRRFAYDLVAYYKPDILVELGSFYGCSAFAFMQAIKDYHLGTKIYPIDLWTAKDSFTVHDYEQNIYGFFNDIKEKEFKDIDVNMLKMTFDEASIRFQNHTIDILHIDGSHSYKDVLHDFETWLPKVKTDGIILFHDISEQLLYGDTLGSCLFWKELKKSYRWTVELLYSWGLGILFLNKEVYDDFVNKVDLNFYLKINTFEETICKDRIRKDYFKLQDAEKWINSLKSDKDILEKDNQRLLQELEKTKLNYEKTDREKDVYIQELHNTISAYQKEAEEVKKDYEKTDQEKDVYIQELHLTISAYQKETEKMKKDYEKTDQEKNVYIQELRNTISAYQKETEKIKRDYERTIKGKDDYIAELEENQNDLKYRCK